jgi:hypothetical protein
MEVNIDDFINQVQNQDFSKATVTFSDLMDTKVSDALEQEKISMADQIFNGVEAEEESTDDEDMDDISDEELEAAAAEVEAEESEEEEEED